MGNALKTLLSCSSTLRNAGLSIVRVFSKLWAMYVAATKWAESKGEPRVPAPPTVYAPTESSGTKANKKNNYSVTEPSASRSIRGLTE